MYGADYEGMMKRIIPQMRGYGQRQPTSRTIPSRSSYYGNYGYPQQQRYGYYGGNQGYSPQMQTGGNYRPRLQKSHNALQFSPWGSMPNYFDDMNLDDVYGNDFEDSMQNPWTLHSETAPVAPSQPFEHPENSPAARPRQTQETIDKGQPLVLLLERNKYCRSPIVRLGNVNDAFECAELAVSQDNCSPIFYTGPLSNECTCAHVSAPCVYEDSSKGNSLFQVVTPQKLLSNPQ